MIKLKISKFIIILFCSFLLFILDRIIKIIAKSGETFETIFVDFKYTPNPYIAFSIPISGFLLYFLIGLGIFFIISSLIIEVRQKEWLGFLGFNLILIGAISNLLDRIFTGSVTDYFVFLGISVLNLSDIFIFIGIVIVLISIFKTNKKDKLFFKK
ncbi:MAG TPA: signal peptidase II, partial [Patescibacteria group bacterium]|nr:signal peptidase II [Patescibacteria group bacterium]